MASRVFVHVGSPKTGTTALQDLLFSQGPALRRRDVLYPHARADEHFTAALDLTGVSWAGLEEGARGAWDRLAAQVRAWPGTAILSHEILAQATQAQARRAIADLDSEVHVVVTARDLGRQIPAEWQENLKHRRVMSFARFLEEIAKPEPEKHIASWFWAVQDLPGVLERWGATLPPEQVHVVTVPPPGAPLDLLWQRFAGVVGLDPQAYPLRPTQTNASLGAAEVAVLREVNRHTRSTLSNEAYRVVVRDHLVRKALAAGPAPIRLTTPPVATAWALEVARGWIATISERGYAVAGDLEDLLPRPTEDFTDPDQPPLEEFNAAAMRALIAAAEEAGRLMDERDALRRALDVATGGRAAARKARARKAAEALAARSGLAARYVARYRAGRRDGSR